MCVCVRARARTLCVNEGQARKTCAPEERASVQNGPTRPSAQTSAAAAAACPPQLLKKKWGKKEKEASVIRRYSPCPTA